MEKFIAAGNKLEYTLQPLSHIHMKSSLQGEFEPTNFDIAYAYLFVAVALFILIIACINFMNLLYGTLRKSCKRVGLFSVRT